MDENNTNPTQPNQPNTAVTPPTPEPQVPGPVVSSVPESTPNPAPAEAPQEQAMPHSDTIKPETPSDDEPKEPGSSAAVWILVVIIVLFILGLGGYFVWSNNQATDLVQPTTAPTPSASASPTPVANADQTVNADAATVALAKLSTSDDTASIKKDLDDTNLDNLDTESADIVKEAQ